MLAVATEQGSVHIMNTSKRNDWDFGTKLIYIPFHSLNKSNRAAPYNLATSPQRNL